MALVTVAQVLQSMGLDLKYEDKMAEAVTAAVDRALVLIEGYLGTKMYLHQATDLFSPKNDIMAGISEGGLMKLRLSGGFVSELDNPVSVAWSDVWNGTYTELTVGDDYIVNTEPGLVLVDNKYDERVIRVIYRHGFRDEQDFLPLLRDAVLSAVPASLQSGQESNSDVSGEAAKQSGRTNFTINMLWSLQRNFSNAFRPFSTLREKVV